MPDLNDPDLREIFHKGYRVFHVVGGEEGEARVEVVAVHHMARQFGGGSGLE